jgi:hypothetical protein
MKPAKMHLFEQVCATRLHERLFTQRYVQIVPYLFSQQLELPRLQTLQVIQRTMQVPAKRHRLMFREKLVLAHGAYVTFVDFTLPHCASIFAFRGLSGGLRLLLLSLLVPTRHSGLLLDRYTTQQFVYLSLDKTQLPSHCVA